MNFHKKARVLISLLAAIAAGPISAQGGPTGLEVLVIGNTSLYVIDPVSTAFTSHDISDPDNDSLPDTPHGIAVSTVRGGDFAFVTYEEGKIAVIDLATRRIASVHHVAGLVISSGCAAAPPTAIDLGGCATSIRRRFTDALGTPVVRADLHVAATTPGGEAFFVVLDQERLIDAGGGAVIDCGVLEAGAEGLDVTSIDTPFGDAFARALYTVGQTGTAPEQVAVYEVASGRGASDPWQATELGRAELPTGGSIPSTLKPGSAPGRELAVQPQSDGNPLLNPYLLGECDPGGNLVAAEVTGSGINSYEVWALDHDNDSLILVDPTDCDTSTVVVDSGPVAMTTLGRVNFGAVFVVNRDADSVSRVNADGTVTPIFLATGGGPCTVCPRDIATGRVQLCDVGTLRMQRSGIGPLGEIVIRLAWDPGECAPGTEYLVQCGCRSDFPDCPCGGCDCTDPGHPPECECPFFAFPAPPPMGGGNPPAPLILAADPPDLFSEENPWLDLGVTTEPEFEHIVDAENAAGLEYQIKPNQ